MAQPCGSGECNIWTRRRLLESLPEKAETRRLVAPPEVPEGRYAVPAVLLVGGALACLLGGAGIVVGLLLAALGVVLGVRTRQSVVRAQVELERWERSRVCVSCDRLLSPPGVYERI